MTSDLGGLGPNPGLSIFLPPRIRQWPMTVILYNYFFCSYVCLLSKLWGFFLVQGVFFPLKLLKKLKSERKKFFPNYKI